MAVETLRYEYRFKRWMMLLSGAFFAACMAVFWFKARGNDRGLILNHLIELDQGQATIFYWAFFLVSAAFVGMTAFNMALSFQDGREVIVDARGITAPKGLWSSVYVHVPFSAITNLQLRQVRPQKFLIITHLAGKLSIPRSMLPNKDDFDTLVAAIVARVRV